MLTETLTASPLDTVQETAPGRPIGAHCLPHILFCVFQTGRLANGGVESVTAIISDLKDWQRTIVTNRETPFCERWRRSGARVIIWNLPYEMGTPFRSAGLSGMFRRLASMMRTNLQVALWAFSTRRAVIHCNDPGPFWHVAIAARLARAPLIFNLRDTKSYEEGLDVRKYRRRFRLCSRILVLSREMKDFYQSAACSHDDKEYPSIDYIYSMVDSERMRPLQPAERMATRQALGIEDKTLAIGFVATFNDKKNQLDYIQRAVPLLRDLIPAARTFFIGDFDPETDSYAAACREAARARQLEASLHFAGFSSHVEKWYQACDVVIVPTRKEGLARCMIEALACGTPVVSFDVSSAREILELNHCGRVVPQGDYEQLCSVVAELANSSSVRLKYVTNAITAARRLFSAETSMSNYRRLILNLTCQS